MLYGKIVDASVGIQPLHGEGPCGACLEAPLAIVTGVGTPLVAFQPKGGQQLSKE